MWMTSCGMRFLALFSGGKDSTLSLHRAVEAGHEPCLLLTVAPRLSDSWMFHTVALEMAALQAGAMGLPHRYAEVSGEREGEVEELLGALRGLRDELGFECIVSGGVASSYQRRRIDMIADRLGIRHLSPLWGLSGDDILTELTRRGFEVVITAVSAAGLGREWIGRRLDEDAVRELKGLSRLYGINPVGEGGEMETLVLDAPLCRRRIRIEEYGVEWLGSRGYMVIKRASLSEKPDPREG